MVIPGQPQHIIVRGNNRSEIFCCDADYRFYLEKLQAACKKHDCQVHAYVLMTEHQRGQTRLIDRNIKK
jgi:putative transposase